MKLICLLTHGLGDWYLPLSLLSSIIRERNIEQLKIYVDSAYFSIGGNGYHLNRETGTAMLNSVTKNWEVVPPQYFGSGDWYGIPNRYNGPQYEDIKYDFLFYRLPQLKEYMKGVLQRETEPYIFICGTGMWSYEWNGVENIPLDFSGREPLKFQVPENKEFLDEIIAEEGTLVHLRKKSSYTDNNYFNEILDYCHEKGKKTILLGFKNEVGVNPSEMNYDFRGNFPEMGTFIPLDHLVNSTSPNAIFYLIEHNKYMITSSSVYTHHRFNFNLPTILTIPETSGYGFCKRENAILPIDLNNSNYKVYDAAKPHLNEMKRDINNWVK